MLPKAVSNTRGSMNFMRSHGLFCLPANVTSHYLGEEEGDTSLFCLVFNCKRKSIDIVLAMLLPLMVSEYRDQKRRHKNQ